MPIDRMDRGYKPLEIELPKEVEQSLEMVIGRLDQLTNEDITAVQAERYYMGARHIKKSPDQYPQYQDKMNFIDKVIDTYENSLPMAKAANE